MKVSGNKENEYVKQQCTSASEYLISIILRDKAKACLAVLIRRSPIIELAALL